MAESKAAFDSGHPRDEWVEVTRLGDFAPRYVLAIDGREAVIAEAKELYAIGRISLDELIARVSAELLSNPAWSLDDSLKGIPTIAERDDHG